MSASPVTTQETTELEELPTSLSGWNAELSSSRAELPSWKEEVNARLMAHRTRRGRSDKEQPALPGLEQARQESRAARVAARVAERYSKAPTYSEMLAQEAANAARAANAAAAAAHEAHSAAQAILAGLDMVGFDSEESYRDEHAPAPGYRSQETARAQERPPVAQHVEAPRVQYHVHPDSLPQARQAPAHEQQNREAPAGRTRITEAIEDPFEDAFVAAAQPLPAKLLEFPRELIATRKARPRIAEGPLREADNEPEGSQLRIFEVEPEAISHEALAQEPLAEQNLPEWHSIRLDAHPDAHPEARGEQTLGRQPIRKSMADADADTDPYTALLEMIPLHVAPMEDRLMAGIFDAALVMIAFLLFVLVFAACTAHPPTGKPVIAVAAALLAGFYMLYQWLFFNFAEGTPGMRYAKIALCTFDDENPTRRNTLHRVAALVLSALPAGLGFLWAMLDDDRLTWHDRITRTYQRSYK